VSYFAAGGIFGGALLIAALVMTGIVFAPFGPRDWRAFATGAIVTSLWVLAVFVLLFIVLRLFGSKP
jgi:hypothetical protein